MFESFWTRLRQFFGFLSKPSSPRKKGSPKEKGLSFAEIENWLEKQAEHRLAGIEKDSLNRFSEVRFLLKNIDEKLRELEKRDVEEEEGNARLRKVVSSSQHTMVGRMQNLLQKLEPPRLHEQAVIQEYGSTALPILRKEMASFGKNIAYTGILMGDSVKGIGSQMAELEKVLKELFESLGPSSFAAQVESCRFAIREVQGLLEEQRRLDSESGRLEKELREREKQSEEADAVLAQAKQSKEALALESVQQELLELDNQKESLKQELSGLLGGIEKPLKRFHQLVAAGNWQLEKSQSAFLDLLDKNPGRAFESDPKGIQFKEILVETRKAIDDQKISSKDEKEKGKWLLETERLLDFDFFSRFFWKQNEFEKKRKKLEQFLEEDSFSKTLREKNRVVEQSLLEKAQTDLALQQNRSAFQKNASALSEKKGLLEKQLSGIASSAVTVSFPDS